MSAGQVIGTHGGSLQGATWARNRTVASVGRRGEALTANILTRAVEQGATVLHDLRVPLKGVAANIDHVILSGSTVTLIDSKQWRAGLYWTAKGVTRRWTALTPHADKTSMRLAVNAIRRLLRSHGFGQLPVAPVTVVWSKGLINVRWYTPAVGEVLPGRALHAYLTRQTFEAADPRMVAVLRPFVTSEVN